VTPESRGTNGQDAADGVVCFAGIDWWYHNRGHSEGQIMTRLARRVPVLWVNSIGMRVPRPGRTELAFARYWRKAKSTLRGLRRDASGMWVLSPLFLPRHSARALAFNGRVVGAQVRACCRFLGMERPAAWVTLPTAAPIVARGTWQRCVFSRSDDFAHLPEVDVAAIEGLERELFARADVTVFVNRVLYERDRALAREAQLLDHGVDFDHFAAVDALRSDCPEELRALARPIFGYYGALDEYTIDAELLVAVARRVAPATLLLVGPRQMDLSALGREPNVVWLPQRPYAELPRYAAQFDVALMPWLRNEWIEHCNPIKLKEYLAMGTPVVSTRFPELARYDGLVHVAEDPAEFLDALGRAAEEDDPELRARRRAAVRASSWESLAARVGELLGLPAERV
jgi:glycosyltransferase involved in cell wall biosynthesis